MACRKNMLFSKEQFEEVRNNFLQKEYISPLFLLIEELEIDEESKKELLDFIIKTYIDTFILLFSDE
jgi:hypothetical protein